MRRLPAIILLSVCLSSLCSCEKDSTLYYSTAASGFVKGGVFTSDEGIVFDIVQKTCQESLGEDGRKVIYADILRKSTSANTYQVRARGIYDVLTKDPVKASTVEDDSVLGNNAVGLSKCWISAGYLNAQVLFTYCSTSQTKHTLNLVYEDTKSNVDTLRFTLRHNGKDETYDAGNTTNIVVGNTYTSFPIEDLIPQEKNQVVVTIDYTWHVTSQSKIYPELEHLQTSGILTRR